MKLMKRSLIVLSCALALLSCAGKQKAPVEPHSAAELAGLRVATVTGSCYDFELSARGDLSLQRYNTDSDLLQALTNGKADVVIHDEVVYNPVIRKENGVKIVHIEERSFPTAFVFRKDDAELARTMTGIQRRMIGDGSMQKLKDFWLSDRYALATSFEHIPDEPAGIPIRVATATDSSPISFMVDGEWYGIEIDLLRELGKELHRPLEIKRYDSGSALLSVQSGLADVLCGCIFVTPEREELFQFSEPYHAFHPAYFVRDPEARRSGLGLLTGFRNSIRKNLLVENRWKYITGGLWKTLKISLLAILLGSILGVGIHALGRSRRRWVRSLAGIYNGFMAGIPELVLLLILFYVVFAKSGLSPDMVAVICFSLFFASGASDIYGTSLDAIPHGQTEAGLALGFTRLQTFFHIVLPQAVRRGLPLYKGQCVSLLKGTSIVGYIAIQDLTRAGDIIRSRTFDALLPLLVITVIYFLLVWLIGALLKLATPKTKVL